MVFYCVLCFLIFIYLPAQWINGATFWESIAPNDPFMAIIWLIVVGTVLCLVMGKTGENYEAKNKAVNKGLVKPEATAKDAKEALRIAEVEKQNSLYALEKRQWFLSKYIERSSEMIAHMKRAERWQGEFVTPEIEKEVLTRTSAMFGERMKILEQLKKAGYSIEYRPPLWYLRDEFPKVAKFDYSFWDVKAGNFKDKRLDYWRPSVARWDTKMKIVDGKVIWEGERERR